MPRSRTVSEAKELELTRWAELSSEANNMWHAGIDVSKARLDVYLLLEMDRPAQQAQFDNTPTGYRHLVKWLKRHTVGDGQVCLEATGVYGQAVTQYLYEQGIAVSVVNPARIKKYAESRLERHKTDQIDAKL